MFNKEIHPFEVSKYQQIWSIKYNVYHFPNQRVVVKKWFPKLDQIYFIEKIKIIRLLSFMKIKKVLFFE